MVQIRVTPKTKNPLYYQNPIDFRCYLEMALFEPRPFITYGIHTFDWTADWAARAKPAAMAANCAHPARMVLGPGGL